MSKIYSSKKELIHRIKDGEFNTIERKYIVHNLKGNIVWVVWKENGKKIISCYVFTHTGEKWEFKEYLEKDGFPYDTIPLKTLELSDHIQDKEWRERVRNYNKSRSSLRKKLIQEFKEAEKRGDTLRIHFKEGCNIPNVIMESTIPMNGRSEITHRLYRIPPALVTNIEVIKNEEKKQKE